MIFIRQQHPPHRSTHAYAHRIHCRRPRNSVRPGRRCRCPRGCRRPEQRRCRKPRSPGLAGALVRRAGRRRFRQ
ncbi:hypothetical protein EAO75_29495 [Streptomyces sp. uw30]|nr:hypothetical protein EAO75_29495 [Streptomyces sp. uw30]